MNIHACFPFCLTATEIQASGQPACIRPMDMHHTDQKHMMNLHCHIAAMGSHDQADAMQCKF